jgi:hypothetical protein
MAKHQDFSEDVKRKVLLWSDRHCCVCGKACGVDIEVAHLDAKGKADIDNAIPVCFDCHGAIGRYDDKHPIGSKYKIEELKQRREQIYERYTNKLVPGFLISINENGLKLPRVGTSISPVGRFIPVKAKIKITVYLGGRSLGSVDCVHCEKPYYSGGIVWNLNPGITFNGNFTLPKECVESSEDLRLEVEVTCIDPYEREHKFLPECFTYVREKENQVGGYWFSEPTSFSELKRYMKKC